VRYGVVSDIHSNRLALDAVLRRFRELDVDKVLCAGDVVGYGFEPNECIERLVETEAVTVAGNHDLFVTGHLERAAPAFVSESTEWTRRALGRDSLEYLTALPLQASVPGVRLAHGSLDDPEEYVTRRQQAGAQLSRVASEQPGLTVLILGHTHRAMAYVEGQMHTPSPRRPVISVAATRALLNPGSVGQSRQLEFPPRARAMVLDWPAGRAEFVEVRYDTAAARHGLRAHGLPCSGIHLLPGRLPGRVRAARRAWRCR
jgi:putative phosphoesterase